MRIGIFSDIAEMPYTGPGNHIYNLIRFVRKQTDDHEIVCLHASEGDGGSDLYEDGPHVSVSSNPVRGALQLWSHDIDVLHFTCISAREVYVYPLLLRTENVVTQYGDVHYANPAIAPQSPLVLRRKRWMQPILSRLFSHIFVSSESAKRSFIKGGVPEEKLNVVSPGIDSSFHRLSPDITERDPFLLHVSSFQETRKNPRLLLQAFEAVVENGCDVDLKIAGKDWSRDVLTTYGIGNETAERVQILGKVDEDELKQLYQDCRIYLAPTRHEGFGLTAAEAMACGAPVISHNLSAVPEVVGDAGVLVEDPDDVESFADAIMELLEDDSLRLSLAKKGLEQSSRFSWEKSAQNVIDVYDAIAEKKA